MTLESGEYVIMAKAICPGWVATPMARSAWQAMLKPGQSMDGLLMELKGQNMLRGMIESGDIANMAVFLASEAVRYITGQAMNVCAGMCATL